MQVVSPNHPSKIAADQAAALESPAGLPLERKLAQVAMAALVKHPEGQGGSMALATMFANHQLSEVIGKRIEKP